MRQAGILLPISALPSPYGIGTMGQAARDFIRFLSQGGQAFWQILPICPTSFGDSPYQSFSSYAGNPYFIDLDDLAQEGLLHPEEYRTLDWGADAGQVDYGLMYRQRYPVLRLACQRLLARQPEDYAQFCLQEQDWLEDYALFMALKERYGGVAWDRWPKPERTRQPEALEKARETLSSEMDFWRAVQYLFYHQWHALRALATQAGISIIGDLPIYVAADSVDVWANPEQFQLDKDGTPSFVAGCPPDGFTEDGQLWGNPLFNWPYMASTGYAWWLRRIAFQFRIYDVLRIDHFRGFAAYYAIPWGETTARNGHWCPGPGMDFFRRVQEVLGPRNIIAEDLGYLDDAVRQLLRDTGYPGMKVMEFGFDSRDSSGSSYLPHNYPHNCVVYTGTHDNDTILGWFASAPKEDTAYARRYLRLNEQEGYHWGMMRAAWASVADLVIIQMQDLLGLGSEARINTPSTLGTNWKWRALPGAYDSALACKLGQEMQLYQRLPAGRKTPTT